jgi:hypothetical protein
MHVGGAADSDRLAGAGRHGVCGHPSLACLLAHSGVSILCDQLLAALPESPATTSARATATLATAQVQQLLLSVVCRATFVYIQIVCSATLVAAQVQQLLLCVVQCSCAAFIELQHALLPNGPSCSSLMSWRQLVDCCRNLLPNKF